MAERFTTRVAVFALVRNEKGEILLHQRGPNSYLGGYWDFPSGHGERGESLRETVVRELKEELGLDAAAADAQLVHVDQYFVEVDYINFVFAVDKWSGAPRICEPEKCSAIGWFAPDVLPEKCVNTVRAVEAASGFGDDMTYSVTDAVAYYDRWGFPWQAA